MADMSLFEAIETQRSIRRFSNEPVPDEAIERIVRAATRAPSGGNLQPWHFVVVRDPELKRRIGEYCYQETLMAQAEAQKDLARAAYRELPAWKAGDVLMRSMGDVPVLIFACVTPTAVLPDKGLSRQFMGRAAAGAVYPAVQNLMLAARALGLGTCPTTRFRRFEAEIKQVLGIPEHVEASVLIPLGYPGEGEHFGGSRRKPLEEVLSYDRWGQRAPTRLT